MVKHIMHLILIVLSVLQTVRALPKTQHVTATKGKFFVHTLHSANFFPSTVKVRWEATLNNKPALPSWLSLLPSRHPEIAYLVGTPTTTAGQITLHIISKRIDNFEIRQQMLVVTLIDDIKYHGSTKQVLDVTVKNIEVEEFVGNRKKQIDHLESAIRSTFRGKGVNAYIAEVRPEYVIPYGKEHIFKDKPGTVVSIGTQKSFFPATVHLVHNLKQNPAFCRKSNQVAMNKFFAPAFLVDWCQVQMRNISGTIEEAFSRKRVGSKETHFKLHDLNATPEPPAKEVYGYDGYNFWNSIVLFPAIGILCVVLLLILSVIFFGSREGQKWRDYKTSVEKLEEYISVRESQKHLRELSVQRQLVSMSQDRKTAPTGIHLFLQPRNSTYPSTTSIPRLSKSVSRLNEKESVEHVPVGKQTVAEAAKQRGSSMHLYRNPLDSESEENDSDRSLDEQLE